MKLNEHQYLALRLSIKEHRKRVNWEKIKEITNRMKNWKKYSSASMVIKIIRDQTHSVLLHNKLMKNVYLEQRKPKFVYMYNCSQKNMGKRHFIIGLT